MNSLDAAFGKPPRVRGTSHVMDKTEQKLEDYTANDIPLTDGMGLLGNPWILLGANQMAPSPILYNNDLYSPCS